MLWLAKKVIFGQITNDKVKKLSDVNKSELVLLSILAIITITLGFYPNLILDTVDISVNNLIYNYENEIAQTCACNGLDKASDFAKYWFHNGFLNLEREKMSKSLGNVIYIKDLLNDYQGNHIRLALLSTHYRQPIPWSKKLLDQAKSISSKIAWLFFSYHVYLSSFRF